MRGLQVRGLPLSDDPLLDLGSIHIMLVQFLAGRHLLVVVHTCETYAPSRPTLLAKHITISKDDCQKSAKHRGWHTPVVGMKDNKDEAKMQ